jgi:hypothetical protein
LHGVKLVGLELGVAQPAFGPEFHGVGPVLVPVVNCPLEDRDNGLFAFKSVIDLLRIG